MKHRVYMTGKQRQALIAMTTYVLDAPCLEYLETLTPAALRAHESVKAALGRAEGLPVDVITVIRDLMSDVATELQAAGPEEVDQHPMLRGKRKTLDRARRLLKRYERRQQ